MAEILRWGLLSTANINRALITPLRASQRNKLVAVASRSPETARAYAGQWKIPQAFGSYEEMLASPDVDVVYVSLPNSLHAEWSIRALRAGKHVLCEKPIAIRLEEMDAMIATARETGKVLAEAFMYRHHPQTLQVKQLLESGAIGKVLLVNGAFTFKLENPGDVRLAPELGGGSVWDVGCYPLSYTRAMLGEEPQEVFAWQVQASSGVDMSLTGQLRFPSGALAQVSSSFASPEYTQMTFLGETGSLVVPRPFGPETNEKIVLRRGDEEEILTVPGEELYLGEVEDLADAVLLGKPQRVSLADSRANTAVLLALLESARTGKPVRL